MTRLERLRAKWRRRRRGRRRQIRLWRRTGKRGHRRAGGRHGRAMRKLRRLIRRARRIDWNGRAALTYAPLLAAVREALAVPGLYVTSTTGGTHSPTSWHYRERAVDFGSDDQGEAPEKRAQNRLLDEFGADYFAELFGPAGWYVKNGVVYQGTFPGHADHLHVAVA